MDQQIAYDNHLFAVPDINQARIDSFDKGHEEGREEGEQTGIYKGLSLSKAIIKELKKGELSHEEIAVKFSIPVNEVKLIAHEC